MSNNDIDYSNTIIYKITCKDIQVTDVYVGQTINFVQRKKAHQQSCMNIKNANYNCKVYKVIRAHGGWANWSMDIINFFNCKDHHGARIKEQEYFISLNATLNSIEPLPQPKAGVPRKKTLIDKTLLLCKPCNMQCSSNKVVKPHCESSNHILNTKTIITPKNPQNMSKCEKYACTHCNVVCTRASEWARHVLTRKHKKRTGGYDLVINGDTNIKQHICSKCDKQYVTNGGLWKHKKMCIKNVVPVENVVPNADLVPTADVQTLTTMVMELMKSNGELQKQMVELCKNSNMTINNQTNTNSHNKTFNLQFFLNEQCKDAMNLSDFMNSFELKLEDLESIGELGYVEGITKIMVDRLNAMDIYKRPVHCSDAKRETLYVKNDDKWEKEARNNPKLRYAIKTASFQSMKLTVLWSDTYPESKSSESRLNDKYMKLVFNSTGGTGEIADSEDKIIRRILKEIVIDKTC